MESTIKGFEILNRKLKIANFTGSFHVLLQSLTHLINLILSYEEKELHSIIHEFDYVLSHGRMIGKKGDHSNWLDFVGHHRILPPSKI